MPGYLNPKKSPVLHRPLFKYTDRRVERTVTIDAVTTDASNAEDPTYLRRGFVLGKIDPGAVPVTSPVKYREFTEALVTAGTILDEASAVILLNNTQMDGVNDQVAAVAIEGDPYVADLHFHTPADKATFDFAITDFNPENQY